MHRAASRFFLTSLAALALAMPKPAGAQEAKPSASEREAAALFRAGEAAYKSGDTAAAARAFEAAYALVPRGAALLNAGRSWRAAGDPARAADDLADALERDDLTDSDQQLARDALADLRRNAVATITVAEPLGARLARGEDRQRVVPTTVHLRPGTHTLLVQAADGRAGHLSLTVEPGDARTVRLSLPPPVAAPTAPPPAARGPDGWLWALATLTVTAAGTSVGLGLHARSLRDEFVAGGRTDADARDQALRWRTWTNVAAGTAVVLGALTAWRWWQASRGSHSPTLALASPGALQVRFW